jgi:hypothetical protein
MNNTAALLDAAQAGIDAARVDVRRARAGVDAAAAFLRGCTCKDGRLPCSKCIAAATKRYTRERGNLR